MEDGPHQPLSFAIPNRPFGKKNTVYRSFQWKWFSLHPWLHYVESNDSALCHVCMLAAKQLGCVQIRLSLLVVEKCCNGFQKA